MWVSALKPCYQCTFLCWVQLYCPLYPALLHMTTCRYRRSGLLFWALCSAKEVISLKWLERKDWDVRLCWSFPLPLASSVTLGRSLSSPKPHSAAFKMVFNFLQLDTSLWSRIWLMANIWWRHRASDKVLSTSNIQTLGNSEMMKVFIQMLIWLIGAALMYE